MEEVHSSAYAMHPGSTKMYHTLKEHYWWKGMKRDIAEFVSRCLTCQQVKVEHQKPVGLLQSLLIPQWKHYGFCGRTSTLLEWPRYDMGDCGQTDEISPFPPYQE